jgi:hypothetical protein
MSAFTATAEPRPPLGAVSENLPQSAGKEKYYITTAIAYTNGPPHMGHAYEVSQQLGMCVYVCVCVCVLVLRSPLIFIHHLISSYHSLFPRLCFALFNQPPHYSSS